MNENIQNQDIRAYEVEPILATLEIEKYLKEHPASRVSSMSCGTQNGNFIIFVVYEYTSNNRKVGAYVKEPLIPRIT